MTTPQIKDLVSNAVHFGHRKTRWNPKMKKFIYGEKDGIHFINLEKTISGLEKACTYLKLQAQSGKVILFVGTKPQVSKMIAQLANECGMPYIDKKWPGGLLTNWEVFENRIKYFKDLKEKRDSGELESKYTKKEVSVFTKELVKLENTLGGVGTMTKTPDIVFVVDPHKENLAVLESKKCHIPVVGIIDTNGDPDNIDYLIPANDDSIKSLKYLLGFIQEATLSGKGLHKIVAKDTKQTVGENKEQTQKSGEFRKY